MDRCGVTRPLGVRCFVAYEIPCRVGAVASRALLEAFEHVLRHCRSHLGRILRPQGELPAHEPDDVHRRALHEVQGRFRLRLATTLPSPKRCRSIGVARIQALSAHLVPHPIRGSEA